MIRAHIGRPNRPARAVARGLVVALVAALLGWLPALASAAPLDDLTGHASRFSVTDGILIFGVAPVGTFLLIALIVMRPGQAPKAQRYRPGRDWSAAPSWSGLQPAARSASDARALPAPEQTVPVMDGAGVAAHTSDEHTSDEHTSDEHTSDGHASDGPSAAGPQESRPTGGRSRGGASGSW